MKSRTDLSVNETSDSTDLSGGRDGPDCDYISVIWVPTDKRTYVSTSLDMQQWQYHQMFWYINNYDR